jgi:hypothetical protein
MGRGGGRRRREALFSPPSERKVDLGSGSFSISDISLPPSYHFQIRNPAEHYEGQEEAGRDAAGD